MILPVLRIRWSMNLRRSLLFGVWLACGLACIALDKVLIQRLSSSGKSGLPKVVAECWQALGTCVGMTIFLGAGLMARKEVRGRTFLCFAACLIAAATPAQIFKYAIGRVRPHHAHAASEFFGPSAMLDPALHPIADSMPSGHTTIAFAMAIALARHWPRLRALWISLAVGVGVSRILLGFHYPSDVILGALLGTAMASLILQNINNTSTTTTCVDSGEVEETRYAA